MRQSSRTLLTIVSFAVFLALVPVTVARAACSTPGACALDFSTNGSVTFGTGLPDLGLAAVTIETWFRRDGTGTTATTGDGGVTAVPLVTKGRGESDNGTFDMNYFLGIRSSDNRLVADFEEGAAGTTPGLNHPVAGTTAIATGTWYHAAATYDGTTWRLYLNGMLETQLSVGQPLRSDSIQHAGLATAMTSTGARQGFFDGVLDEVRIWNYARTQAQIQATINQEVASATGLVGRWGLNEGTGASAGDSAGAAQNGTIVGTQGTNWDWTNGSPFNANLPPAQPTLNAPADGATGVATAPTLDVAVSDPEGSPLTVTFWGREATALPDFTIIALPDTQHYVDNPANAPIFTDQTEWIVANKDARNIVFVSQLGDCVENGDNGGNSIEWDRADTSVSILEDPLTTMLPYGIPYGITVGNHDQSPIGNPDGTTTFYNQYFGEARFLGRPYYGGHYGSNNDNHYQLFSASGMDFIVVNFEYDTSPDAAVLAWANGLLQTYSTRRAIIVSHWIVNTGNPGTFGAQGQATYDALKGNPNLFLMLAGHVPGEGRRQDTFDGRTVNSLLADYQTRSNGGNGWLRIMTFSPANNTIAVQTYSPWLDQYETDADSQFTLSYDMGAGFSAIATNSNVPSGSSTTAPWSGRDPGTDYEWYATVGDGTSTTTGPIWSFTTTGGCGDGVLDAGEQCDDGDATSGDGCSASCQVEACHVCVGQPSVCTPTSGGACNDGSLCTTNDTCSSGTCVGGPPPNCDDTNVCTTDGCTPLSGCVHTNNTAPCNDGLFCNGTDTCGGGSCGHTGDPCAGGAECNNVCNEAADSCAVAGGTACASDGNVCTNDQCNGTGACAHPNNTAPCDDGLFCTGTDTCSGGSCGHTGDPCAGGAECNNVCNEAGDSCAVAGGTACTADTNVCTNDQCNGAGACAHPNNTAPCDDGLFCTGTDTCSGGSCGHTGDPCAGGAECNNVCNEGADSCAVAGGTACTADTNVCTNDQCNGAGACAHPNNTAPCDDALFCTGTDTCSGGTCGHTGDPCVGGTECNDACNEGADSCADASGTACTADTNVCTNDQCDGAGVCAHPNNTAPCDDTLFCTGTDTCSGGTCGHAGDPCVGGPECNDACNEGADSCADASGTACTADTNVCTNDQCDGAGACAHPNNIAPCDDTNTCTENDTCSAGVCAGTSGQCGDGTLQGGCNEACDDGNTTPGDGCDASCQFEPCAPTPAAGCRAPVVRAKAQLKIKRGTVDTKDQLQWKWSRGAATTVPEFEDPTTSESYYLCVYDNGQLVSSTTMPAAGICAGKACWKASSTGYQYKDKDLTPDGGAQLKLKAGLDEKAQAQFKGRGSDLETPAPPLTGPVRVQLKQTSGTVCWEATYSSPFVKNDGLSGSFLDKAD